MNDFTKEELKLLKGSISLWMEEIVPVDEKDGDFQNNLFLKLKSMIDNYCEPQCEHAWIIARDEPNPINDCVKLFWICVKCMDVKE